MAIYGNMVVPSKAGGGSLPTNNETPTPYVPGVGVNARFSDAGAQIAGQAAAKAGEGFGNIGKGLQKLGGFGMIMASRENRLDLARADEAFAALQTEAIAKQTEWEKLKGLQGVDVLEMKARWWDDAHARHMEGLGDAGKRYYNLQSDRLGVTLDQWASRYGEQQRTAYEKQAIAFGMDSEANAMALDATNFEAVDRSLAHIRVMCDRSAMNQGLDAATAGQMYQAAASKAVGSTLAILLSQGRKTEAEAFIGRYGNLMTAADYAKVNETYNTLLTQLAAGNVRSGNVGALQGLAAPAGSWNAVLASTAQRMQGTPYKYATMNDCSGYTTVAFKDLIADPAIRAELFGGEGGRGTSEGIVAGAAKYTVPGGEPLRNDQLQPGMVGPGMVIGLDTGRHGKRDAGRKYGMDHIVWTYQREDGTIMVSESSGGGRGVHDTPYAEWYRNNSHNKLYGASLVPLLQGSQPVGPGVPSGFVEYTGKEDRDSLPGRQHNPGAVKPPEGYSTFKSDAEGFLAQAEALRNEKYYGGKNIEQIVLTYVGYNPDKDYWNAVLSQGFTLKEVPNLKDNKVLARLMIGLARGESKLGKHYTPEQIEALLAGGSQTQGRGQAQAPGTKLSGGAKDMYDMVESNIRSGNMTRQQAEDFLQESMQKAKAKTSSRDAATKKMAEGDYEAARQALAVLQGQQASQPGAPAPAPAMQAGFPAQGQALPSMGQNGFTILPQTKLAMDANMIPTQANALYQQAVAGGGTPEEQEERFMRSLDGLDQALKDKVRPLGERWFADMKQDRDRQGQIQYQEAWELLSKGKNRRDQENLYLQLMQSPKLNDVARAKLKARWNEEQQVEKPEGQKWTAEMYGKIDEYWKDSAQASADIDRAIDAAAGSGAITDKQAQDLHEWNRSGGARKALVGDTGYLKQAYNQLLDPKVKKEKWKDVPPELLQRLWQRVKSNGSKAVSQDEIKEMLAEEMSVSYVQAPSFVSRILPAAGLVFPGMMTSTKETRYWQAQTSGEKLVGIVPLPREYAKIAKEAAEHGYDPGDPEAVARYNLIRLTSQRSK